MLSSLLRRSLSGQVSSQARLMSGAVMHQHDMDELYRKHKQNPQQFSVQLVRKLKNSSKISVFFLQLSVQYKIRKEKVLGILKLKEMEIQWESQQKKLAELAKKDGGTVVESDKTEKPTEEKGSMIVMLEEDKTDEDMDESSKSHLPRYVAVDPEVEYVAPAIVKAKRFIPKTSSAAPNIEPSETLSSPSTRPHRYMVL